MNAQCAASGGAVGGGAGGATASIINAFSVGGGTCEAHIIVGSQLLMVLPLLLQLQQLWQGPAAGLRMQLGRLQHLLALELRPLLLSVLEGLLRECDADHPLRVEQGVVMAFHCIRVSNRFRLLCFSFI